jgi:hypothetical protein
MKLKVMTAIIALALIASAAAPALSLRPGVVSAQTDGRVKVTFTKWVIGDVLAGDTATDKADMVGVVGGKVGPGFFFGEILSLADNGTTTSIHALYHLNGSRRMLVADVNIAQSDSTGIAAITGAVTGGPLDGAKVVGEYRTLSPCTMPTPGSIYGNVCFQGSLTITS